MFYIYLKWCKMSSNIGSITLAYVPTTNINHSWVGKCASIHGSYGVYVYSLHTNTNATVRAIHFNKIYQQKIYQVIQATPKIYQVIQAYPVIPSICAKEASELWSVLLPSLLFTTSCSSSISMTISPYSACGDRQGGGIEAFSIWLALCHLWCPGDEKRHLENDLCEERLLDDGVHGVMPANSVKLIQIDGIISSRDNHPTQISEAFSPFRSWEKMSLDSPGKRGTS